MATETGALRKTALYDAHVALGATLVPFAGFEMPVHYGSIVREHDAVRSRAGLFDLSHMAQFELGGEGAGEWLDSMTVNHVATMKPGQARYNIFTNERGGAHDDVIVYRLGERDWMVVVNAANAQKMWSLLRVAVAPGVSLRNRHGERALIALQGPRSLSIFSGLLEPPEREAASAMKYYTSRPLAVGGIEALAARTGYTGEDGFELFVDAGDAKALWNALMRTGETHGLTAVGLGARDMLRLEAGMPLYGFELSEDISPIAGGQAWCVKFDKVSFTGRRALEQQRAAGDFDRIVGLQLAGRAPARHGYPVFENGAQVGEIQSATVAPSVGNACIATALVSKQASAVGTLLGVEIRGKLHEARVVQLPFYKRAS